MRGRQNPHILRIERKNPPPAAQAGEHGERRKVRSLLIAIQSTGVSNYLLQSPMADFTFTALNENTRAVTGYTGSDAEVILPSKNGAGRRVTRIGLGAFTHCTGLTHVTIPGSVKEILLYAFNSCDSLTGPEGMYLFCSALVIRRKNPIMDIMHFMHVFTKGRRENEH